MKKVFAFMLAVLAVLFVNLHFSGSAEAARVAEWPHTSLTSRRSASGLKCSAASWDRS